MKEKKNSILFVVVPCFNEEEVLKETAKRLKEKFTSLIEKKLISNDSHVLLVDDGSKDSTWSIIESLHKEDSLFMGTKLSRNFGHQSALIAGLSVAKDQCDMSISMDADLQDDINAIDAMVEAYYEGNEVVYGVRKSRDKDSFFKKTTAEGFYKLMQSMGVDIVFNHADYRLLSKIAMDRLFEFDEVNLFIRGIVPRIGYKSTTVEYERSERFAGVSKYPFGKMLSFAIDGITSFSTKPLFAIFWLGFTICLLGFAGFVTTLILMFVIGLADIWPVISFIAFIGGLVIMLLGVVGVYIGKTYMEIKHRPIYIIEKNI